MKNVLRVQYKSLFDKNQNTNNLLSYPQPHPTQKNNKQEKPKKETDNVTNSSLKTIHRKLNNEIKTNPTENLGELISSSVPTIDS